MHLDEKEIAATSSSREKEAASEIEVDDDDASISTESRSSIEDTIQRTLSRNAGLDDADKTLAQVNTTATNMVRNSGV